MEYNDNKNNNDIDNKHHLIQNTLICPENNYKLNVITPPHSPEKKELDNVLENETDCTDHVISSTQEDEIVYVPRSYKMNKENKYLLEYVLKPFILINTVEDKPKLENSIISSNLDKKDIVSNFLTEHDITNANQSTCYAGSDSFSSHVQNTENQNINSALSQNNSLCYFSSDKAINFSLGKNMHEPKKTVAQTHLQFAKQNPYGKLNNNSSISNTLTTNPKNYNKNGNSYQDEIYKNDFDFKDNTHKSRAINYDTYEDKYLSHNDKLPIPASSILESPKENPMLDSNDDWYILSDNEYTTENKQQIPNYYSTYSIEKISTRRIKKHHPNLSAPAKYHNVNKQEEYKCPKSFVPKGNEQKLVPQSKIDIKNQTFKGYTNNKMTTFTNIHKPNKNIVCTDKLLSIWNTPDTRNTLSINKNTPQYNDNNNNDQYCNETHINESSRNQIIQKWNNIIEAIKTSNIKNDYYNNLYIHQQTNNNSTSSRQEPYNTTTHLSNMRTNTYSNCNFNSNTQEDEPVYQSFATSRYSRNFPLENNNNDFCTATDISNNVYTNTSHSYKARLTLNYMVNRANINIRKHFNPSNL